MNNWKVTFATVIIFGAGVITGGLLVNYVQHCKAKPVKRAEPVATVTNVATNKVASNQSPPKILGKDFLQRLDVELNLLPSQHEAVAKIIAEGQNLMRKTVQDARLEIREVLTQEQRDQFDELVKRPFKRPLFNTNSVAISTNSILSTNTPPK